MSAARMILNELAPAIRGANPLERWAAARGHFSGGSQSGWVRPALVVLALIVVVCTVWLIYALRQRRREKLRRAFEERSDRFGLSEDERNLLHNIASNSEAGSPGEIFDSPETFERGVLTTTSQETARVGMDRSLVKLCGSCSHLFSLREKLGFDSSTPDESSTSVELGNIRPGTTLSVLRQRRPESFEGTSYGITKENELLIEPEIDVNASPGEIWVVRYPEGGILWEFNALVTRNLTGTVAVKPTGTLRWINRRRFVRVRTNRNAYVAKFPFRRDDSSAAIPEFTPARLVEIAGPGIRLQGSLEIRKGEKLLIVFELGTTKVVEGVGVVRHVTESDSPKATFAVELVGLTTSDVADLTMETSRAAIEGRTPDRSREYAPASVNMEKET